MVVISDTSPLNYLVLAGKVDILPRLYTSIRIPEQVIGESERSARPSRCGWINRRLEWLIVDTSEVRSDAEARLPDVILLIDETRGRNAATIRRIPVLGTLGLLAAAGAHGLLDLPAALGRLQQTKFSRFRPTDRPIARE